MDDTTNDVTERLDSACGRINKIIHVPTMIMHGEASDAVEDFLGDWINCKGGLPDVLNLADKVEDLPDVEDLLDDPDWYFEDCQPWILEVAVATKEHYGNRGAYSISWGITTLQLVTGDTFDEAVQRAIDWCNANGWKDVA